MYMYQFLYKTDIFVRSKKAYGFKKLGKIPNIYLKTFERMSLQIWNLDKEHTNIKAIVPFV